MSLLQIYPRILFCIVHHAILTSSVVCTPLQAQKDVFNALEQSPTGNDMDFIAKLHLVEKHIRNNNLKLSFAEQLGRASNQANDEISTQVSHQTH